MNQQSIRALDTQDPLAAYRQHFALPTGVIYLDGNSLGALPRKVKQRMNRAIDQEWGEDLIGSWNKHGWIDLPRRVGEKIAPLIGAAAGQVICCDSISVNLFKLLSYALSCRPGRRVVLSQHDNFPTDLYVVEGLVDLLGANRCVLKTVAVDEIFGAINDTVAVVLLTHVNFRNGAMHDIARLTAAAQAQGALVIWDLAHSAGAVPLALDDWRVDFAVGCGYKYLNGGPGAPAFLYVAERHQRSAQQALSGWMGHQAPFAFAQHYFPADDIQRFLAGTPNILSMVALDAALDVFADLDPERLREKSLKLGDLFVALVNERPELQSLQLLTPMLPENRGSQLSFAHPEAYAICQALASLKVIADFRAPDVLRFGLTPLYLRYEDIWLSVEKLSQVMVQKLYAIPEFQVRKKVT